MDLAAEWLEPNGSGGFASGTVGLVRTRRYHSLLLTADPRGRRYVLVNGVEVWVETPMIRAAITTQAYLGGTLFPDGQSHLHEFRPDPFPTWFYELPDGTSVEFALFCAMKEAETVLRWTLDRPADITVRPLLSGRDYHALHHENGNFRFASDNVAGARVWTPYPGVPAIAARGDFAWKDDTVWYRRFDYSEERARGLDNGEDLASPGLFTWRSVRQATLAFRADAPGSRSLPDMAKAERTRRSRPPLYVAADAYLARRSERPTVLAGFPWFADWGRDTFIAMRGLLIGREQWQEALAVLMTWRGHVSHGMLPARFPDAGSEPEYNSVDSALWFVVAVYELLAGGQVKAPDAQELRAASRAVLECYAAGTRFGIRLDPEDGLLRAGIPGVQLTWMDAKVGDHVITPRIGKPVEVQALWINAMAAAGSWPGGERWRLLAAQARQSLAERFPDPATGGLIDVLDAPEIPGGRDRRIRPNQILAAGGIAWMAMFALNLMRIALTLAEAEPVYESMALKFFRHFLLIADAMTRTGGIGLWNEEDEFSCDVLPLPDGNAIPLRVRTIVGLIPLLAIEVIDSDMVGRLPEFHAGLKQMLARCPDLAALISHWSLPGEADRRLLSLLRGHRMKRLLARMLDAAEFLSSNGIRALSRVHRERPFEVDAAGMRLSVGYDPGEGRSSAFGGNSNWRGPVWMPINLLLIDALHEFHRYYGDDFRVPYPAGSDETLPLDTISDRLSQLLGRLFLRDADRRRAIWGDAALLQNHSDFRDHLLFDEYFHGDNGRGLGASHQTGWTACIALLLAGREGPWQRLWRDAAP